MISGVAAHDEAFLLGLLNTTPTVSGTRMDWLGDDQRAREWLTEQSGQQGQAEDIALLRATRDRLQGVVRGEAAPTTLAPALQGVSYRAAMAEDGISWELAAPGEHALAARAVVAWDALERRAPGRLRPCENVGECSLFLIDRSKSNTARWCSMSGCGNRMKARRHYERRKSVTVATS